MEWYWIVLICLGCFVGGTWAGIEIVRLAILKVFRNRF